MSAASPHRAALAALMDHTLLTPEAGVAAVRRACEEGRAWGCASVCIHPRWVPVAARILQDSPTRVCTVIGFPHGATTPGVKVHEANEAIEAGAAELDMVLSLGPLCDGDDRAVAADIEAVVRAANRVPVKVIVESGLLDTPRLVRACAIARDAGARFVKTSTGFASVGATIAAVQTMRATVGDALGVKASGGIRTLAQARAMIDAGASRLGTSRTGEILQACPADIP